MPNASLPPMMKQKKQGIGAIKVDGKMIDVPVAVRAERLLARYDAIMAKGET